LGTDSSRIDTNPTLVLCDHSAFRLSTHTTICKMCFGSRKEDEAGDARSKELDKIIRADEKRLQKEVKLLLLGTSHLVPCRRWKTN
jgi:hypothetical protein